MILELVLALSIAIAHYISEIFCLSCNENKIKIISFTAGISIVYIFLGLLPEFYREASTILVYSSIFIGFAGFHLIDKEIYQKIKHSHVPNDIKVAHGFGLSIYYFVIGLTLVNLLNIDTKAGVLFFIPVFIYSFLSTVAGHGIHGMHGPHHKTLLHLRIIQSSSVLVGAILALILVISNILQTYLIGLVAGILTFIVVRDILPKGKKGKPLFFIIGALIYFFIIYFLRSI